MTARNIFSKTTLFQRIVIFQKQQPSQKHEAQNFKKSARRLRLSSPPMPVGKEVARMALQPSSFLSSSLFTWQLELLRRVDAPHRLYKLLSYSKPIDKLSTTFVHRAMHHISNSALVKVERPFETQPWFNLSSAAGLEPAQTRNNNSTNQPNN